MPLNHKLINVKKLCELSEPYLYFNDSHSLFIKAMIEITNWHKEHSSFYQKLSESLNYEENQINDIEDLAKIPYLWAHFFKSHELLSIKKSDVYLHLTSSGTSGQKSQIFFDEWTITTAQKMVDLIFETYGWVSAKQKCNYLLFSYETESSSKLGTAYTDNFLCKYAPVNNVFHALKLNGEGGHEFDSFGTITTLLNYAKENLPVRIFGFPAFFFNAIKKMKKLQMSPIVLHPDSLVFLGGGWKGFANLEIPKKEFYSLVEEMLGIKNERIRDGFGSVEHCVPYIECQHHQFHIPVWSRVLIRDVKNLSVLDYGEVGFLNFISPYITSMPAHSIIMGDLATLHRASECACGTMTPFFKIIGRAGTSKNKSCALAASEMLKGNNHDL